MTRPLRIEYPGACYHVINRGNRGYQVFFSDSDYTLFLDKLAEYVDLYDVELFSYCLMPNHYHLFLKTKHANLGRFMQSFNTSFTLCMNKKQDKSGHLFQGRYKAQLVETERYKNVLSRYIHLNPVKLKSQSNESLAILKKLLRDYKWSSFRYYLGLAQKPDWLNMSFVFASWGKTINEQIKNYRKYVEEGLLSNNSKEMSPNEISNIIGTDYFRDKIIRQYLKTTEKNIDEREQPDFAKINSISIDEIISSTCKYFHLKNPKSIIVRKAADRNARKIAMYLSVIYCKKTNSLAIIASYFGIGINGISSNTQRCKETLLTNKTFNKHIQKIDALLHESTKAKV